MEQGSMSKNKIIRRDFNYTKHAKLIEEIANRENSEKYIFDENNRDAFKLMLLYFNGYQDFETMLLERNYSLSKGILLLGPVGSGKSSMFKIFKKYCFYTNLKNNNFRIEEARTIAKYFARHGNTDIYDYNFQSINGVEHKKPFNLCIDDLGIEQDKVKYFGTEQMPVPDLLLDRYTVFENYGIKTHITTNLNTEQLREYYGQRIQDRLKQMVNVIPLLGKSRRK